QRLLDNVTFTFNGQSRTYWKGSKWERRPFRCPHINLQPFRHMTNEERVSLLGHDPDLEQDDFGKSGEVIETGKILGLPASTISIIIVEFCERFAFYGSTLCFTICRSSVLCR
ncbi:hypothetical protein BVRB_032730, partial [Beta vulgaris subsp. vulgaris]